MGQVAKRVEDKRLLKLIRVFLNAGVMEMGWSVRAWKELRKEVLFAPARSSLVLDELDRELE